MKLSLLALGNLLSHNLFSRHTYVLLPTPALPDPVIATDFKLTTPGKGSHRGYPRRSCRLCHRTLKRDDTCGNRMCENFGHNNHHVSEMESMRRYRQDSGVRVAALQTGKQMVPTYCRYCGHRIKGTTCSHCGR